MLLKSFQDFLSRDGNNLLPARYRTKLSKFTLDYCSHVIDEVKKMNKRRHFRQARASDDWQLSEAA